MPTFSSGFARLDGVEEISLGDILPSAAATLEEAEMAAFRKLVPPGYSVLQVLQDGRGMLRRMYAL